MPWFVCFLLLASGLNAGTASPSGESDTATNLPDVISVSSIAYRDFSKKLKEWGKSWAAGGRRESAIQQYASDIDNYEITISADTNRVYVTFKIKPFQGTESFGGISRYVLDRKSHEILERTGEK
jgi:hypothetical protein